MNTILIMITILLIVNIAVGYKVIKIYEKEINKNKEDIKKVENTIAHYQKNVNNTLTETIRQRKKVEYTYEVSKKMDMYISKRTLRPRNYRNYVRMKRCKTTTLASSGVKVGYRLK